MRPSTHELDDTTGSIILRVDVKEALDGNALAGRILAHRLDVVNPETRAVVTLVRKAIHNVKVVIDSLVISRKERSSRLGIAQIRQVDNVGNRAARSSRTCGFDFVELVVQEHVLVPVALGPPALVAVGRTGVRERG